MNKKTYWWRILVALLGTILFGWSYLVTNAYELNICHKNSYCFFQYAKYIDQIAFYSLFMIIISPFLFFINDKIFLKWIRFAGVWIVLSILAITITPSHSQGILSFGGPSKELVSIWMGALFVILSLAKIALAYRRKK
ncbi:MAG: hypothetical protein WA055_05685 [Candidatus Moraniibacteriota bacterium]